MLKLSMKAMTPDMMRRFWKVVSEIGRPELALQEDETILRVLLDACQTQHPFSSLDNSELNSYISERIPLIRDLVLG
jgi:hypothetical protein